MFSRRAQFPPRFFFCSFLFCGFSRAAQSRCLRVLWKGADLFTLVREPACIDLDLDAFTSFKDPAGVTGAAAAAYRDISQLMSNEGAAWRSP